MTTLTRRLLPVAFLIAACGGGDGPMPGSDSSTPPPASGTQDALGGQANDGAPSADAPLGAPDAGPSSPTDAAVVEAAGDQGTPGTDTIPRADVTLPPGDASSTMSWPTFPGAVASIVSDTTQVVDFFLADNERAIATVSSEPRGSGTCDVNGLDLLYHDGTQFWAAPAASRGAEYHHAFFTADSQRLAFVEMRGRDCSYGTDFVSMRVNAPERSSGSSGATWQRLLGMYGNTALTVGWRYPNTISEPEAYRLHDLGAGAYGVSFGKSSPRVDPTGKAAVWVMEPSMMVLSGIDKKNPVALSSPTLPWVQQLVWAPDGSTLAFSRVRGGGDTRETVSLINRDGTNLRDLATDVAPLRRLIYSADGRQLVWDSEDATGARQIWVHLLGPGPAMMIAGAPSPQQFAWNESSLHFTPSGQSVVLRSLPDPGPSYIAPASGGSFTRLPASEALSVDERWVAYRLGVETLVAPVPPATGTGRVVALDSDFDPVFPAVPGLLRLAVSEKRSGTSSDLVLMDPDGGNRVVLPHKVPRSSTLLTGTSFLARARRWTYPAWIGRTLIYLTAVRAVTPPNTTTIRVFDLMAVSADGQTAGVLATDVTAFAWVPRNPTSIFVVRQLATGPGRLWRVSLP